MREIEYVSTTDQLCESLRSFNQDGHTHVEAVKRMIRQQRYWIYDATSADFCPGLFAAFKNMDFGRYRYFTQNRERPPVHGKFDGTRAAKVVARVSGKTFQSDPSLALQLREWASHIVGENAFGKADANKWMFLTIQDMDLHTSQGKATTQRSNSTLLDLDRDLALIEEKLEEDGYFDSSAVRDERERRLREVVQRRGQARFRETVLRAYDRKCAITQCDAVDALEAAHILPYSGPTTDYAANGLLLRADLHTLFDLDLLGIDPKSHTVKMASRLLKSSYGSMNGVSLALPGHAADRPNKSALLKRWQQFKSRG